MTVCMDDRIIDYNNVSINNVYNIEMNETNAGDVDDRHYNVKQLVLLPIEIKTEERIHQRPKKPCMDFIKTVVMDVSKRQLMRS